MKIATFFLILIFAGAGFLYLDGDYFPCDHAVLYKLGEVDPRFNLSLDEAKQNIDEAAAIWNRAYGKTTLRSDPDAILTINFVYDRRQQLATQLNDQEKSTTRDKAALEAKTAVFQAKLTDFQARVNALNGEISGWNSKGGAPKDIYDGLIARQNTLQSEEQQLRAEADNLKISINNFNFQVDKLNGTVDTFNNVISVKPEAGLFDGKDQKIYIYYVNSASELVHTLAHELGHARNVDHVSNQTAIMYPFRSQSSVLAPEDITALNAACRKIRNFDVLTEDAVEGFLFL